MGFQEQAVDPHGGRGAGQRLDERAIATGLPAEAGRLLHRVGGVEDHGDAEPAHRQEPREVVDEPTVAEERATLAQQRVATAPGQQFGDGVLHVGGCHELSLLHVDGPTGRRGRQQDVGLPAQEGRNLQHIADLSGRDRLLRKMHVGGHGQADDRPHAFEHRQPLVDAGAAKRAVARAVGLVERRLEDGLQPEVGRDGRDRLGDLEAQVLRLDHAGARNEQEGLPGPAQMRPHHGWQPRIHDDLPSSGVGRPWPRRTHRRALLRCRRGIIAMPIRQRGFPRAASRLRLS